jgi:hypothetical protein
MAYDPAKRAAREARFRAEHGVSSGTWYRMRRQATAAGVKPAAFDKLARQQGYGTARDFTIAKRTLSRGYDRGITPSASDMQSMYPIDYEDAEDYDLDLEWFWYH